MTHSKDIAAAVRSRLRRMSYEPLYGAEEMREAVAASPRADPRADGARGTVAAEIARRYRGAAGVAVEVERARTAAMGSSWPPS